MVDIMPKVSVIVPVYNVEKYLRECMDSIVGQTLEDIEIICIDDGSTDGSGRILDEYASRDDRVHVVHKKNEGYGKAINVGMELAKAPYAAIVESDDFISPGMYERLYEVIEENGSDIVKSDYHIFYTAKDGHRIVRYYSLNEFDFPDVYGRNVNVDSEPCIMRYMNYTWTSLYRVGFLRENGIVHNETPGAAYQDNGFWFQTMVCAEKIFFLPEAFYHYRFDNPAASFFNKRLPFAELGEYEFVEKKLERMGDRGRSYYKYCYYMMIVTTLFAFHRVSDELREQVAVRLRKVMLELFEKPGFDLGLIDDGLKPQLFDILANPEFAAKRESEKLNRLLSGIGDHDRIIIYGAGNYARALYAMLHRERLELLVDCFVVSDPENNPDTLFDIPVRSIDDINFGGSVLCIIAVKNNAGIEEKLRAKSFRDIVFYPDLI